MKYLVSLLWIAVFFCSCGQGESAETTVTKFKGLTDNFEDIYNTIISYANFLEQAADSYDAAENANVQGAQSQQS